MSTAHDYEDVHHLVDRLTPPQVRRLRLLLDQDAELAAAATAAEPDDRSGLLALIGSVDGPLDLAERHDAHLRDRFSGSA